MYIGYPVSLMCNDCPGEYQIRMIPFGYDIHFHYRDNGGYDPYYKNKIDLVLRFKIISSYVT